MQIHEGMQCCNFVELVGFNGHANKDDLDIYDDSVFNIEGGVLAVACFMNAWAEEPAGLGSVFMAAAWDKYADDAEEVEHICSWARGGGRSRRTYAGRLRRFIRYIHDHGLGKVHSIPDVLNPNHMSTIRTRIWHVDNKAVVEWAQNRDNPTQDRESIW